MFAIFDILEDAQTLLFVSFESVELSPISFLYSVKKLVLIINLSESIKFLVNHLVCFKILSDEFKIFSANVEFKNLLLVFLK
jgi:hypothetical protein